MLKGKIKSWLKARISYKSYKKKPIAYMNFEQNREGNFFIRLTLNNEITILNLKTNILETAIELLKYTMKEFCRLNKEKGTPFKKLTVIYPKKKVSGWPGMNL